MQCVSVNFCVDFNIKFIILIISRADDCNDRFAKTIWKSIKSLVIYGLSFISFIYNHIKLAAQFIKINGTVMSINETIIWLGISLLSLVFVMTIFRMIKDYQQIAPAEIIQQEYQPDYVPVEN